MKVILTVVVIPDTIGIARVSESAVSSTALDAFSWRFRGSQEVREFTYKLILIASALQIGQRMGTALGMSGLC